MASLHTSTTAVPAPFYFDDKWRLSTRKEQQQQPQPPSRSCSRSSSSGDFPAPLMMKSSSTSSAQHRRCCFTRKCARLVREQRARFYIMRRCVTMLICWRDCGDS